MVRRVFSGWSSHHPNLCFYADQHPSYSIISNPNVSIFK